MEVTSVEAIPIAYDLPEGRGYGSSRGTFSARFTTLVRLELDDGTVGWGEAFAPARPTAAAVEEIVADWAVGTSAFAVENFAERAYTSLYHFGGGAFLESAVSGVDIAMWDALGRSLGRPVHELLGGASRTEVTPYASTMYVTEWGQDPAEPVLEAAEEGFTAAKIKIGRGVEDDVERVRVAREILGEDAHLMVDFNGNYRPDQAIRAAEAIAPYDPYWIEEPVPPQTPSGYGEVRRHVSVPIAAGEAAYGRFQFRELVGERQVDIVQPNIGRVGGFTEGRFVGKLATVENVAVTPHVWNSGVGIAAALQLAAFLPEFPHSTTRPDPFLFEFDRADNDLRTEILEEPLDPTGGSLEVPTDPGIGVEVDPAAVERYRIDR